MKPITFKGKEVADVIHTSTKFIPSIKMRLQFLFCRRVFIDQEIGCENAPGNTSAINTVHIILPFDAIKSYWRGKTCYGQMEAPQSEKPCALQSQEQ